MRPLRLTLWLLLTLLALAVSAYSLAYLLVPEIGGEMRARLGTMPLAMWAHIGGGLVAMAIGPFQLHRELRAKALNLHRAMGRLYAAAVLAGSLGGLWLALNASGGLTARTGFGTLAILWLIVTAIAIARIRARNQPSHREWMIRSFALTLAAVTLRIYLPLSLANGVPFPVAYPIIAWACWVPNLLVAEAIIRATRAGQLAPAPARI